MALREGLVFEISIESDCAPLAAPVLDLLKNGVDVPCLRDLTRGGLATVLAELAELSGYDLSIVESAIPISEGVQGACEILGLDPLSVANEGRFIAFIAEEDRRKALDIQPSVKTLYFDDLSRKLNAPGIGCPYEVDDTQRRPC